jgi:hypothetical protein
LQFLILHSQKEIWDDIKLHWEFDLMDCS